MRGKRIAVLIGVTCGLAGTAAGVAYAAFTATTSNPASSMAAQRIYPAQRTTSAWSLEDAADGSAADDSAPTGFAGDGLTFNTTAWTTTFSSSRFVDIDFNSSLPAGLPVSSVKFNLDFASNGGTTGCMYFEVRTASTGAVLGTFGSSGSPVSCQSTTLGASTTDISSVVATTDIGNDLRIRIYGKETNSKGFKLDRATITGTGYAPFTLYRTRIDDEANAGSSVTYWSLVAAGDSSVFQNAGNWATSYASGRYLKFTFPRYLPSNADVTGATFDFTYKSQTSGNNTCYYFEVYSGSTLLATHGSTSSDVDCNATTSYETISTSLPEVDTAAEANSVVVKLYAKNSGSKPVLVDAALLNVTYSLGVGSGCADPSTTTLQASGDAWGDQNSPTSNFGTNTNLDVQANGSKNRRTFVTFDLPALGSGCSLTGATLRLYLNTTGGTRTIDAYQGNSSWTEGAVTWNTQPTTTGSPVSVASGSAASWMTWTVTSMVQSMAAGTNSGFLLKDSNEASGNIKQSYMSREAANPPELVLTIG